MKKSTILFQLLLVFLLLLITGCGSDEDNQVYNKKETLYCNLHTCSNESVYCKIINRTVLECEIFIQTKELINEYSKNNSERN